MLKDDILALARHAGLELLAGLVLHGYSHRFELLSGTDGLVVSTRFLFVNRIQSIPRSDLLYFSLPREPIHPPGSPFESLE